MSLKKFYYTKLPILDSHGKKVGEVARPIIEIIIKYKRGEMVGPIAALIDSGADYNLFPSYMCQSLGINLKSGQKFSVRGVSGDKIITYRHFGIRIFVEGDAVDTFIDFSDFYHEIPILGQQGFFDKFRSVRFSRSKEEIVLET